MKFDDDPLWYDRAELDEPLNIFVMVLIGAIVVAETFYIGAANLCQALRGGVALAFRESKL